MKDLIEQLGRASEGSRELDALIYRAVREPGWTTDDEYTPLYTSSVDAALTLVPEGWTFGVNTFAPNEVFNPGGAQAYVMRADALGKSDAGGYQHAEAATPALALCIAALKARSAE